MDWMQNAHWENRMKSRKKEKPVKYKHTGLLIVIGIVLAVVSFCMLTWYDRQRVNQVADQTLAFVKKHVERFENYTENDKIKDLYHLLEKTQELDERLKDSSHGQKEMILSYVKEQHLSGVVVLDGKRNCVYESAAGEYERWKDIVLSDSVQKLIRYPQEVYLTQMTRDGNVYEIAAIARKDKDGALICYAGKSEREIYEEKRNMKELLSGFSFDMDGVVAITDGAHIQSSNEEDLQGLSTDQSFALYKENSRVQKGKLVCLNGKDGQWYGKAKRMKSYNLYAFFPAASVHMTRITGTVGILAAYLMLVLLFMLFRSYTERRSMLQIQRHEQAYQQKLRESAQAAEQANMAKTDFLRRMSHDIRTPINGIRGMVEICRHSMGDPQKQEECLDKIMASSSFLMELVNDVLDMNKLESGNIRLEEKPFDLLEVLQEVNDVIGVQAESCGVSYLVENDKLPYHYLIGSSLHLRQVLQNIISNGVKYNRVGGMVHVIYRELSMDNNRILLEFICTDTGCGMSPEFQSHAFEPFAQEEGAVRTRYAGTGLGLPIAKKLVEQMGGSISFASVQGEGTTFTIRIPFQVDEERKNNPQNSTQKYSIEWLKILLAEDNDLNMEIAEFVLQNAGAQVTKAWNGKEALELFEQSEEGTYDVILMDLMMPVMGGLEATAKIRELDRPDAKTIVIIAMTANAFMDDVERSLAAGMNAHLPKPLDAEKLIEEICKQQSSDTV